MRSFYLLPTVITAATALPKGQVDERSVVARQPNPVNLDVTAFTAAEISARSATELATSLKLETRTSACSPSCSPEPTSKNIYFVDVSSADAFVKDWRIKTLATLAVPPLKYKKTFTNLQGATEGDGYLGYAIIPLYSPLICAKKCDDTPGCQSFNIFFERDPSFTPATKCPNPKATANIKCSFWSIPTTPTTATNTGQWRYDFEVVIAGSNGYTSTKPPSAPSPPSKPIPGYTGPASLGNASIVAPLDCNGVDTYMGYQTFNGALFDPSLCAKACDEVSSFNSDHPPEDGSGVRLCAFFNTYVSLKNGKSEGQVCALYSEPWDGGYATNTGQTRDGDVYTIQNSVTYYNTTRPGYPVCK